MIEPKYVGDYADRDDVAKDFQVGTGNRWGGDFVMAADFPTDEQILYARYESYGYEGSAFVLFERDGKLYEVNGSHCSCYGLEGQWEPEETSWAALAMRQPSSYGAPVEVITEAKKRVGEPASIEP